MIRLLVIFGLLLQVVLGCQVPVFRYALERWEADPFRLQVVYREPLDPGFGKILEGISGERSTHTPPLNLEIEVLDVNKLTAVQQLSVVGLDRIAAFPAILLHPPASWGGFPPLVFEATKASLQRILDSPARQRCVDGLLAGESAVWVLIESGDETADQAAYEQLEHALNRASQEIKIPDGVVLHDEIEKAGDEVNLDDVLRSSIPLKISFKIERLKRNDPAEQAFIAILAGPSGVGSGGPVIVPVFGRGRTPGPVPASAVTEERIVQACAYLCGACSCLVKSGNPGYDLLLRAEWHEHLQGGLVVIEKSLPPLPGVGGLTDFARSGVATIPAPPRAGNSLRIWWIAGLALLVVLILGSLGLARNIQS